ncbi:MAG: hypothetical protein HQ556_10695 [Candidatus Marinimicrobia bacterium]|nr:hypothetical protein [Candidatus Neomarinimicrobiota bacterium]
MEKIMQKETPILDFGILIYKNLKSLVYFNSAVAVLAIVYLLTLDQTFQSTAIVSVQEESGGAGLASMISEVMPFSLGFGGGSEVQKYMGILELQRVLDVVIEKYKLQEIYDKKTMEETYRATRENLAVYDREDGTFSISFMYDNEPQIAKEIVETFYQELQKITLELNQDAASKYRTYIEEAHEKAATELVVSETSFSSYQYESGILKLDDQIAATIASISELEMMKVEAQIELEFLNRTLGADYPEIKSKQIEVQIVDAKIKEMKRGNESFILSFENLPENSMDYYRRFRDVTVNTRITEFLALQLEQAKIEEMKNTVNLFLLDPPQVPDRKIKPKRLSILIMILFFSGSLSVLTLQFRDYLRENKELITSKI